MIKDSVIDARRRSLRKLQTEATAIDGSYRRRLAVYGRRTGSRSG